MEEGIRQKILKDLEARREIGPDSIDILNGQVMYGDFEEAGLFSLSDFFPFNEAMAVGPVDRQIFSRDFIRLRSSYHEINIQEYEKITVKTLDNFLTGNYSSIGLWFGSDMFCQINLLTLLGYLDEISYGGRVFFYKINEENYDFQRQEIKIKGYKKAYDRLFLEGEEPGESVIDTISSSSKDYLGLKKDDNVLEKYIRNNISRNKEELASEMLVKFRDFGYGDLQYKKLIEAIRESKK